MRDHRIRCVSGLFFLLSFCATLCLFTPSPADALSPANLPFLEDFESGTLGDFWQRHSYGYGRIRIHTPDNPPSGTRSLAMDSYRVSYYSLNELILMVDLAGRTDVRLRFHHRSYGDEDHPLPSSFDGSRAGDGVSISADGRHWYKVQGLTRQEGATSAWKTFEVALDPIANSAGIPYTNTFLIKFQQYDNFPIQSDGFDFDDIEVFTSDQDDVNDIDNDGLPDDWEREAFGGLAEDPEGDFDQDGLDNATEYELGTDPADSDSDHDGMPDGWEVEYKFNPLDAQDAGKDADNDGVTNLEEYKAGTDPLAAPAPAPVSSAPFPFSEDFESGSLGPFWERSSNGAGRVVVNSSVNPDGTRSLVMDSSVNGRYSLNELILTIDLQGVSGVELRFRHKEFNDEDHGLPAAFDGSYPGDGVSISEDGVRWHTVLSLTRGQSLTWIDNVIDLDAAAAAAGIQYNRAFKIKFQQYDNYPVTTDGFAFDDILLDHSQALPSPGDNTLKWEEQEVVRLLNLQRRQHGLPPLSLDNRLCAAARRHSEDMARNNFMSHTGSDGSSPWDRIREAGYPLYRGGENVAAGQTSPQAVINSWMSSYGHRANMLSWGFCHVGVGYAYNGGSRYRHYWTLDLGCDH